jgi:hypothetical protein
MNPYGIKLGALQTIKFDLRNKTWRDFVEILKANNKNEFTISTHYGGKNYAHDSGATRNFFVKIWNQLTKELGIIDGFYFRLDPNNDFWLDFANLRAFVHLIALTLKTCATVSSHFHPTFWKIFSGEESYAEGILESYVENVDLDSYQRVSQLTDEEFEESDSGYNSKEEFYEHVVCKNLTDEDYVLFYSISEFVPIYFDFNYASEEVSKLDVALSGDYVLDSDAVIQLFEYENFDKNKINLWKKLIKSLNQSELKDMLLLFGSSLRTFDVKYTLVCEATNKMDHHLKIFVCSRRIKIHVFLFENFQVLSSIRSYFADAHSESISDSTATSSSINLRTDVDSDDFEEDEENEEDDDGFYENFDGSSNEDIEESDNENEDTEPDYLQSDDEVVDIEESDVEESDVEESDVEESDDE